MNGLLGVKPWRFSCSIDPFEKKLDQRLAVRQAMQLLRFTDELAVADLLLDGVQRLDLLQGFGGAGGLRGQRLEEAAPAMRPASSVIDPGLLGVLLVGGIAVGQ